MQALLDETQLELRDLAQQIAESIGIANPSDLKDHDPGWATLVEAGLVELRDRSDGEPAAGGVDVAIICEALAGTVAPAPYLPTVVVVDRPGGRSFHVGWSVTATGSNTRKCLRESSKVH